MGYEMPRYIISRRKPRKSPNSNYPYPNFLAPIHSQFEETHTQENSMKKLEKKELRVRLCDLPISDFNKLKHYLDFLDPSNSDFDLKSDGNGAYISITDPKYIKTFGVGLLFAGFSLKELEFGIPPDKAEHGKEEVRTAELAYSDIFL